ncbi:MAG: M28 family peptidase [Flavobacteriaceae bacterium]|nr:M28 family peptidase [Bacteroidia bacterium]NNF76309.1 M28 family peptidase [Flavobacteriaceae bacterium]
MRLFIFLLALVIISCKSGDVKIDNQNDSEKIESFMEFLSSDDLGGRETGTAGIEKAAIFIEEQFNHNELKPYFNTFRDSFKIKDIDGFNIVGTLKGNDPGLSDEYILIGAHYDHIGQRAKPVNLDSIANGANDNAAGTTAVLMLANYFAKSKSNKRSLIFALFSGEEMGLQGSQHLSKRLKDQNLDLYTMINFEMVGVPLIDRDYLAFISGYDLSNMAKKINEYARSNLIGKSDVAVKYNLFKRSDNYPFYLDFLVPSQTISSCDLTNYDFYHHVDDEVDKMDFDYMANLIEQLFPAIEAIANSKEKEIQLYGE